MTLSHAELARRVAVELRDAEYVNLAIWLPTTLASYIPDGVGVVLPNESEILGAGPYLFEGEERLDLINAGKETITVVARAAHFDSDLSSAMVRGGHLDTAVLGAFQVSGPGDLANYKSPRQDGKGDGRSNGPGARRVIVTMDHVAKDGSPKVWGDARSRSPSAVSSIGSSPTSPSSTSPPTALCYARPLRRPQSPRSRP